LWSYNGPHSTKFKPVGASFLGLDASVVIAFKTKDQDNLGLPETARLLGQEWDKILAGQNCLPIAAQLRHPISTNRRARRVQI
jgi:hypothetical protein